MRRVYTTHNNQVLQYRVNSIHQNRTLTPLSNDYLLSSYNETYYAQCDPLVLLHRFYATGRLSNTGDGFQLGYRWLSVRGNGPFVAKSLCRREGKSCGLAAILASSSDTGMYVTSNFLPVFSSYALNTSLNDYAHVSDQTSLKPEGHVARYLMVPSDRKRPVLQLFGWKMCQDIGNISSNVGPRGERKRLIAIATN